MNAVLEQPSSLRLAGCGNEHALFRALDRPRLRGYVLRLRHEQNAAISMASPSPLPALVASLGEALVQHPIALVTIEDALAAKLADVARQGRDPPLALAHSTILAMEAALLTKDGSGDSSDGLSVASAWLERDHLLLDGDGFGLCIELKPKAGLLPAGEPLASIAPGRCRFCLYASLKAKQRSGKAPAGDRSAVSAASAAPHGPSRTMVSVASPSASVGSQSIDAAPALPSLGSAAEYCPLDMYSGETQRVASAIRALLRAPKGNLRVFDSQSGDLIYGGVAMPSSQEAAALHLLLHRLVTSGDGDDDGGGDGGGGDGGDGGGGDGGVDAAVAAAAAVEPHPHAIEDEAAQNELFVELLTSILGQEGHAMALLCAAQARARIGSNHLMALHEHATKLAGGRRQLHELIVAHQAACRCVGGAACACQVRGVASAQAGRPCVQGCIRPVCDHSLADCVCTLSEWLLGLAASDVSLMIAIKGCRGGGAGESTEGGGDGGSPEATARPQSQRGWQSSYGMVRLPRRAGGGGGSEDGGSTAMMLRYRLAVVDIGGKPPRKIEEHFELDRQIALHWERRVGRPLHACELPAVSLWPGRQPSAISRSIVGEGGGFIGSKCGLATLVVAFGTRGDVLPLLCASHALMAGGTDVIFATHECFRALIVKEMAAHKAQESQAATVRSSQRHGELNFVSVPTDPLRPRLDAEGVESEYAPILALLSSRRHTHALRGGCGVGSVLFNLFSLGGWHLAEALGVPSVALSPCVVPYAPPAGFEGTFRAQYPVLHRELQKANGDGASGSEDCDRIGWAEVEHWMWPLWAVERWGEWRARRLGLDPLPLSRAATLMRPTPLLYAISAAVLPRPAYWPRSVTTIGYLQPTTAWLPSAASAAAQSSLAPLPTAGAGVDAAAAEGADEAEDGEASKAMEVLRSHRALYVGFGCSSALLVPPLAPTAQLAEAIAYASLGAARSLRCPLLLHSCGHTELHEAWAAVVSRANQQESATGRAAGRVPPELPPRLLLVRGELPIDWIFGHCIAVVHHGGAGTAASALRAGTPQLILPLVFDQFTTAERLSHLGVCTRLEREALEARSSPDDEGECDGGGEATSRGAEAMLAAIRASMAPEAASRRLAVQTALQGEGARAGALACECIQSEAARGRREEAEDKMTVAKDGGGTAAGGCTAATDATAVVASSGRTAGVTSNLLAAAHRWKRARNDVADRSDETPPVPLRSQLPDGTYAWCHSPSELHYIFDEIYVRESYLPQGAGITLPHPNHRHDAAPLIVDCGANVGLFSLWAAARAPSCRILAIEPSTRTFELLKRNLDERGASGRVSTVCAAVGGTDGAEASLTWFASMPGNSTLHPEAAERDAAVAFRPERREAMLRAPGTCVERCPMRTLSALLAEAANERSLRRQRRHHHQQQLTQQPLPTIALLKVDVEGSEVDLLRGVVETDWRRIEQVVIETHSAEARLECARVLGRHYSVVGEQIDDGLLRCGLDRAIVYARS